MQIGMDTTRHDRATAIHNAIDEVEDVPSAKISDAASTPKRYYVPFKSPRH